MLEQVVPVNTVNEWCIEIGIDVWELIERLGTWKTASAAK
jgi:hypothetical protein